MSTLSLLVLLAAAPPELVVQSGHQQAIAAVAVSRDGALAATAEVYSGVLKLWDLRARLEVRTLRLPSDASGLAFLPDGRLAIATTASTLLLLDPATGAVVRTLQGVAGGSDEKQAEGLAIMNLSAPVAVSAAGLVAVGTPILDAAKGSSGPAGTRVYRSTGVVAHTLVGEGAGMGGLLSAVDLASAGDRLVQATGAGEVEAWQLAPPRRLFKRKLGEPGSGPRWVGFSPTGDLVAVAVANDVHLLDARTGVTVLTVSQPAPVTAAAWTPGGALVTVADGVLRRRDAPRTGKVDLELKLGRGVQALAQVPGGDVLLAASGGVVLLVDAQRGVVAGALGAHTPELAEVVPLGPHGLLIGSAGQLVYWDELTRAAGLPVADVGGDFKALERSPDGAGALVLWRDEVSQWLGRYVAGEARLRWRVRVANGEGPRYAPSGKEVSLLVGRREVVTFDAETGAPRRRLLVAQQGSSTLPRVVFDHQLVEEQGRVVTLTAGGAGGNDCRVDAWFDDAEDPRHFFVVEEHGPVTELAVTHGGRRMALAYPEGWQVHLVDGDTGPRVLQVNGRALAFDPAGDRLAIATTGGELVVVDSGTGAELARREMSASIMDRVSWSADGRRLVGTARDGVIRVWDARTLAPLALLFARGTARLVVVDGGDYVGSRELLDNVAWRVGARAWPFATFDLQHARPARVMALLGEGDEARIRGLLEAERARLERMGLGAAPVVDPAALPTVQLERRSVPLTTAAASVTLEVNAADAKGLSALLVSVNGVPLDGAAGRPLGGKPVAAMKVVVPLAPGANRIDVQARSTRGLASLAERVEVYGSTSPAPDLYLVTVGVSAYRDQRYTLSWPAKDARDVAALFRAQAGRYRAVHETVLTDGEVTLEALAAVRKALEASRPQDEVVLFFAGHGLLGADHRYWFATADLDFGKPELRGLGWDALTGLLDGVPARQRLVLLDTCHAGDRDEPGAVVAALPANVTRKAAARGLEDDEQPPANVSRLVEDFFTDLRADGATVVAAAAGTEFAFESAEWRNGVFTFALREGVERGRADLDHDGRVDVAELRRYVADRVAELTNGLQRPVARRENLLGEARVVATVQRVDAGTP
jgi:WD40 repeat protein